MNLKKHGLDYANFAIKTGEDYTRRAIDMWEKVPNTDQWYGLYQEALKELYLHEFGKKYLEYRARHLRTALETDPGSKAGDDLYQSPEDSGRS